MIVPEVAEAVEAVEVAEEVDACGGVLRAAFIVDVSSLGTDDVGRAAAVPVFVPAAAAGAAVPAAVVSPFALLSEA